MRDEIASLAADMLPTIETALSEAARRERVDRDSDVADVQRQLAECVDAQQHVVTVLERLVRTVSDGTELAKLTKELTELGDRQQELAAESEQMLRDWLANPQKSVAERTEESIQQQKQIARRLTRTTQQMENLAEDLAERQPKLSEKLQQACQACRQADVSNTMYQAAQQLSQGRLSNSSQLQRKATDDVRKVKDMLTQQSKRRSDSRSSAKSSQSKKPSRPSNKPGKNPSESGETTGKVLEAASSRDQVAELVEKLWGHLPQRDRQQIVQPVGEDFLPQYAEDIEAYFRALAEPDPARDD